MVSFHGTYLMDTGILLWFIDFFSGTLQENKMEVGWNTCFASVEPIICLWKSMGVPFGKDLELVDFP